MEKITVKLTELQQKEFRTAARFKKHAKALVREVMSELIDTIAEQEDRMWTQAADICGVSLLTHELQIDWCSGNLTATPHDSASGEASK